jgi:hypothetical protein
MADETEVLAPETDNPAPEQDTTVAAEAETVAPVDGEKEVAPAWRDDWRTVMAAGDDKELKRLERFKSPQDVHRSMRELEKKLSSGKLKEDLSADATPEQLAAFRKANGIPEKPDGYLEKLPDGLVIGADDKPMVESLLGRIHGKNPDPAVVSEMLGWYYDQKEAMASAQSEADKAYERTATDALREEWGGEYRGNLNSINSMLASEPAADDGTPLAGLLMGARLADGTLLGNNPATLRWLARIADERNPAGFVAPGVGGSQIETIESEINSIKDKMRTDRASYDRDASMQKRYQTLISARDKLSAR